MDQAAEAIAADDLADWLDGLVSRPRRDQPERLVRPRRVADRAAVEAALTTPWSTGPLEGHIHRGKLIKRAGYVRRHAHRHRR